MVIMPPPAWGERDRGSRTGSGASTRMTFGPLSDTFFGCSSFLPAGPTSGRSGTFILAATLGDSPGVTVSTGASPPSSGGVDVASTGVASGAIAAAEAGGVCSTVSAATVGSVVGSGAGSGFGLALALALAFLAAFFTFFRAFSTSTGAAVSTAVVPPSASLPPNHSRMVCDRPIDTADMWFVMSGMSSA